MSKHSPTEAATLRDAAYKLNTLWQIEAGRGLCDSLDSAEYQRVALAPRLRAMADQLDPPLRELLREFGIDTFFLSQRIGCSVTDLANWLRGEGELDDLAEAKLGIVRDTLRLAQPVAS